MKKLVLTELNISLETGDERLSSKVTPHPLDQMHIIKVIGMQGMHIEMEEILMTFWSFDHSDPYCFDYKLDYRVGMFAGITA